jgi:hypothetical protein
MKRASVCLFEPMERRTLLSMTFESAFAVGNRDEDTLRAVDVDEQGNTFYMGLFNGPVHLDPRAGTAAVGVGHGKRGVVGTYLAKRDSEGNFAWGFQLFPQEDGRTSGWGLAHDDAGNIYASGIVDKDGDARLFISKFSADGQELWTRVSSPAATTFRAPVATDESGDVLVTGTFKGALDLDGDGTMDITSDTPSDVDAFVAKFSSDGNITWAQKIISQSESGFVSPRDIAVDGEGSVLTTGWFQGAVDFDPGPSETLVSPALAFETYVLKLDRRGDFKWVKTTQSFETTTIDVDQEGNVYTAGTFEGTVDFDPGPGERLLSSPPPSQDEDFLGAVSDVYIRKLNSSGELVWAIRAAESDNIIADQPKLAVGEAGTVYVTFGFNGRLDVDPAGCGAIFEGMQDTLLLKLNTDGHYLQAGQISAGDWPNNPYPIDIAVNGKGDILLGGNFVGTVDVDPTGGKLEFSSVSSGQDSFIVRLSDAQPAAIPVAGRSAAHHRRPAMSRDSAQTRVKHLKAQIRAAKAHGEHLGALRKQLRRARAALKQ